MNQPSKAPRTPRNGTATHKNEKKSRVELDQEARQRKRMKKRSGNASGSRTQVDAAHQKNKTGGQAKDPRIGSKVPVALVVEAKEQSKLPKKPKIKVPEQPRLSPEEELTKLENDERLDTLLERLDDGDTLNTEDQVYVDHTLDRIDELMKELGIELGDEDDDEEQKEDILKLLKGGQKDLYS